VAPALLACRAALAAQERALHRVIHRVEGEIAVLQCSAKEAAELRDWDYPEDVQSQ
jgi:hypothetical protein